MRLRALPAGALFTLFLMSLLLGGTVVPAAAQEAELEPEPIAPASTSEAGGVTPTGAFLRSLVLPGWGQMAAGSPHRGAVYLAMEAGSVWMTVKSRQGLADVRREMALVEADGTLTAELREARLTSLRTLRRERENQVEDWMAFAIFTAFLSAADALVAAYLQDFDEHLELGAQPDGGVSVGVRFSLGGNR
jgi:hypothetical protein